MLYIHMLAYNTPKMIQGALDNFQKTFKEPCNHQKFLVDPHYPGTSQKTLKRFAFNYGWIYLSMSENLGVAGNWNWVQKTIGLESHDIFFGMDPDARIQEAGWNIPLLEAFEEVKDAAYICLDRPGIRKAIAHEEVGEHLVKFNQLTSWSVGAFHGRFLTKSAGLGQLHPLYGYIESWCEKKLHDLGLNWYCLKGFYDHHEKAEQDYVDWKLECALDRTREPFEKWLEKKKPVK